MMHAKQTGGGGKRTPLGGLQAYKRAPKSHLQPHLISLQASRPRCVMHVPECCRIITLQVAELARFPKEILFLGSSPCHQYQGLIRVHVKEASWRLRRKFIYHMLIPTVQYAGLDIRNTMKPTNAFASREHKGVPAVRSCLAPGKALINPSRPPYPLDHQCRVRRWRRVCLPRVSMDCRRSCRFSSRLVPSSD